MAPLMATALGFLLLTANSILAIHRSWGDAAATIFVIASYASLVLLFYFLRLFETAPPGSPAATKLGFGALILNSALAIYNSWDDAGSVAFVLVAVAALLLLVLRLREFEMATVWALTTLLTAMFAWRVVPIMPLAVGVLVFLCLREIDQVRGGEGGAWINMGEQYSALATVGIAVLTCTAALDTYDARRDPGSAAFVVVSYVVLVVLMGLFVRAFAQARASD